MPSPLVANWEKLAYGEGDLFSITRDMPAVATHTDIVSAKVGKRIVLCGLFISSGGGPGTKINNLRIYWHDGSTEQGDILGSTAEPYVHGLSSLEMAPEYPIAVAKQNDWRIDMEAIVVNSVVAVTFTGVYMPKTKLL